jgi:hypothetical protein
LFEHRGWRPGAQAFNTATDRCNAHTRGLLAESVVPGTMTRTTMQRLLLVLACLAPIAQAFYLPGVAPADFKRVSGQSRRARCT